MTAETSLARYLTSYHWTQDRDAFGGYSGIAIDRDGTGFVLLSDRAHLIEGTIFRHDDQIIGVRSAELAPLDFPASLFESTPQRDTEGIARDGAGRLYVSLESDNRVIRRDRDGTWSILPPHPAIDVLPINRGLEALAVGTDGTVYALPEVSDGLQHPFPVFRYRESVGWDQPMSITRSNGFLPVGADIGPDGRLYVLERGFGGFGFSSRVRRFGLDSGAAAPGETLFTSAPRTHDNLEGLAVWQAEDNTVRLTMVSDDNFSVFQKTEIVEYLVSI